MSIPKNALLRLGDLVHAHVERHNEPMVFRSIVAETPMNAGNGVALVAYRQPSDDELAMKMAAASQLLEALQALIREHDAVFAGRTDGAQDAYYNAHPGRAIAYRNARAAVAMATCQEGGAA